MYRSTRRDFLAASFGAAALTRLGAQPQKRLATDWVTLGKSNVKVTRIALGTGTFGGRVQRELGQEAFTSLVRHAYDRGIRFFETAESYHGMPEMLGIALKGLPRESYALMTKYSTPGSGSAPGPKIDDFRRTLQTEYIGADLGPGRRRGEPFSPAHPRGHGRPHRGRIGGRGLRA